MEVIGIQKENSFFHLAYLSSVNGDIVIQSLEKVNAIPTLKKELLPTTGIEGEDLFIRHFVTPLTHPKALQKTLPFQLETLIPYPLDEVVIRPIYDIKKKETDITFFAVLKRKLHDHIFYFQEKGVDSEWICPIPMALARFAHFVSPHQEKLIIFHIGKEKMELISVQKEKILNHVTVHMGSQDLDCSNRSAMIIKLKQEIDRVLCFLVNKEEDQGCRKVLFCGEEGQEIGDILTEEFPLIVPMMIKEHGNFDRETLCTYAISIGLAIDPLKNDSLSVQLRQEGFISKKTHSSMKKKILCGGILSCLLFVLIFVGFSIVYHLQEVNLIDSIKQNVSSYQKDLPVLTQGVEGNSLDEILSILHLKLLSSKGEDIMFSPSPLVTNFLNFIDSHPRLEDVEVKTIDYKLKSYPSFCNPQDQYHPKVLLSFVTKEAKKAREFHDAILNDQKVVDKSKEIEWKRNGDEYEITFFLQN